MGPSWRTRGLDAAAQLTGLNITIPPQPKNPDELVDAFRNIGAGTGAILPAKGSAKAWMAHLDLLKFVIASGPETALIIEDDVDWDVEIKSQMRLVSDNIRNYMTTVPSDPTPFGTDWDVLWLGHCGALAMNLDGSEMPINPLIYADETRSKLLECVFSRSPYAVSMKILKNDPVAIAHLPSSIFHQSASYLWTLACYKTVAPIIERSGKLMRRLHCHSYKQQVHQLVEEIQR